MVLYDTTTEEIAEHIGRLTSLKLASNVKLAIELLEEVKHTSNIRAPQEGLVWYSAGIILVLA